MRNLFRLMTILAAAMLCGCAASGIRALEFESRELTADLERQLAANEALNRALMESQEHRRELTSRMHTLSSGASSGVASDPSALEVFGGIVDDVAVDFTGRDPVTGALVLLPRGATAPPSSQAPEAAAEPAFSVDIQRRIIYTGRLAIDTADVEAAVKQAGKLARDLGGYVQKQTNTEITIRVPAAKFDEAVEKVAELGVVRDKSIEAQDVTEEYMDLTLRLESRQAYMEQLKKMLADAKDMKVMLEIQRELSKTIEEIERLKGKLRYLANRVQLSMIAINFRELHGRGVESFRLPFPWLSDLGLGPLLSM